ncbi:acidic leucine-rich nuclear phosphoprotein 32 family member A [Tanacetum coccineum]
MGSLVQAGLQCSFKDQWKDKKNKLKAQGFSNYDSVQEAREKPPPDDWKRSAGEWQELIDFWADPKRMDIAKKNAQNRAKKKTTSHQGSKSFAQGRHEFGPQQVSSTPTPSSSTHLHDALAEFNSDPNLYQDIMNPSGPVRGDKEDEDEDEDGDDDDNDDE